MPALGVRAKARDLTEIVDRDFKTAGHLRSYAGLALVTSRSGTSIRDSHSSSQRNKVLKRALLTFGAYGT
ncbi:transposase [Paeniglutamicibacter sp. NPDC091659]|uniref:transposase n=1 Tax=Paeniglutamicibacter sp. NPDC091659 TaxID=3364389 RepID=UPI0038006F43